MMWKPRGWFLLVAVALLFWGCGGSSGGGGGGGGDTTAPVVSAAPPGGTYAAAQNVVLSADETATIYYTTDGTVPTVNSTEYAAPIAIAVSTTLRFFGVDTAGNESAVVSAQYTIGADDTPPEISADPPAGSYADVQNVVLSANETATIYYTTDGTTPMAGSDVYSAPIEIAAGTLLKFFGVDTAGNESTVVSAQYDVGTAIAVSGRVLFPGGAPVEGASVTLSVVNDDALAAIRAARQAWYAESSLPGEDGSKPRAARREMPRLVLRTLQSVLTTTDASGEFASSDLLSAVYPIRVLAEVAYEANGVEVTSSRWGDLAVAGQDLVLDDISIPDPGEEGIALVVEQDGVTGAVSGENEDGSIQVANLPAEVERIVGRSFNPGDQSGESADEAAFPGEFSEMGNIPLNSTAFVWMEAFDADGNPVTDFSQAASMRSLIPEEQWVDLEDLTRGTDRIEIPIYVYNEDIEMWEEQEAVGWLEDEEGTVLGEDWQDLILDGTYPGELYAAWTTTHFSWMNVDYAYIGPWTLSRMSRDKRNNDCLYKASRLAEKIFRTSWANTAYADVNKPGSAENPFTLSEEVPDRGSTEFKDGDLGDTTFGQTTSRDFKELLHLNSKLWDKCDTNKKETIFAMAVTILHETAHWKHDAKKHDGVYADEADVGGEAGLRIEKNLFGDSIWTTDGKLPVTGLRTGSNTTVTSDMLDDLTDPQWWEDNDANFSQDFWNQYWASGGTGPDAGRLVARAAAEGESPLTVTLSMAESTFDLGASVPVTVTYENTGTESIDVLDVLALQGYPLHFTVTDDQGVAVPFIGAKVKTGVSTDDYVTLAPGETYEAVVDLTGDEELAISYFNFTHSGDYTVSALYNEYWGLPETTSNSVTFTLSPGGSLTGNVGDASSNTGIAGATVRVYDGDTEIASATSDISGNYAFEELPPGIYDVKAVARGFVSVLETGIEIVTNTESSQDFLLTALLASGQIRIVLTWGATPSDLDSHLWLPADVQYHLYYSNKGNQLDSDPEPDYDGCPYAMLDVDDTSSYGPETITILQRVRSGEYVYGVYSYSGSNLATVDPAPQVEVFDASGLIATFTAPSTLPEGVTGGRWWNVFAIDGATGAISEVNQLADLSPAPYTTTSDCPFLPTVNFSTSTQTVAESVGTATLQVQLSGSSETGVIVPYTVSGTAVEGAEADFTISPPSPIAIPAGETSADITITVNDDSEVEGSETIIFDIGVPTDAIPGYTIRQTVTITDDDTQ